MGRFLKKKEEFDYFHHPECSHNIIHNAGEQCRWDTWSMEDSIKGTKPEDYLKDSDRIVNIYTCTMCGQGFWSSDKCFDIPHYRVKEVKRSGR